ncbi:MAG: hypothetical protein FWD89_02875 [Firmicutes bacterium]|nr:hypothetical protein [Bacillota bacterium]
MKQYTYAMIKPHIMKKENREEIIEQIIEMIEEAGLAVYIEEDITFTPKLVQSHYGHTNTEAYNKRAGYNVFEELTRIWTGQTVRGFIIEGDDAEARLKALVGPTMQEDWNEGTIRFLLGESTTNNVIHCTDPKDVGMLNGETVSAGALEIHRFFPQYFEELFYFDK